jgi:hypothetical protein
MHVWGSNIYQLYVAHTTKASMNGEGRDRSSSSCPTIEEQQLAQAARDALHERDRLQKAVHDNRNDNKLMGLVLHLAKAQISHLNLEFKANCLALRRNDPDTRMWDGHASTDAPNYALIDGYARPLGEALKGNTIASALYVNLRNLLKSDDYPPSNALAYVEPLVSYVSNTKALKFLKIDGRRSSSSIDVPLTVAFLDAIGHSSSMEELTLFDCHLPCGAFRAMMTTTLSLRKLVLRDLQDHEDYSASDLADLGVAFRENQSLERVWLGYDCEVNPMLQILSALSGHPTLQELVLFGNGNSDGSMNPWSTICHCLCSLPSLRHLKLVYFVFSADKMRAFLNCLLRQDNGDDLFASITKLTLQECDLDDESALLFVEFMHTKTEGDSSPGISSRLRELCLADPPGSYRPVWATGPSVVSLLLPFQASDTNGGQQTIGSQLSSLSLNISVFEGFLQALEASAPQIRLDTLRLFGFGVDCCESLKNCVDCMPCLRHLRLAVKNEQALCVRMILEMLRASGRLYSIIVEDVIVPSHDSAAEYTVALLDDVGLRLASAYCLRNQHLTHLLDRERESAQPAPSDRAGQATYPTLLQAAKQISKSQISLLSASLWKLGDCIGPRC